jgi:hypothetical protein
MRKEINEEDTLSALEINPNVIARVVGQPLEVGQRQPQNLRNMALL